MDKVHAYANAHEWACTHRDRQIQTKLDAEKSRVLGYSLTRIADEDIKAENGECT